MKLFYVLSVTLIMNALSAASINVVRPKRNLVWVKNMMANLFGYKRPHANHRITYTVPEYLIFQPATIAPQYMNQNIYQGPLTKMLFPCYMQNQPFIAFGQQNVPLYIYSTDECNYRTILNSDYLNINGPQYSPYPLKYYDQILNPETIRSDKQTYSRNMEPVQDKFNEISSKCNEEAKLTGSKIPNYEAEEQIRNKVGFTKAPQLAESKDNFDSLSTSTISAISTTPVTYTTLAPSTTPVTSTTLAPSTTSVTSTTLAPSTTPVTSTTLAPSTTPVTSTTSAPPATPVTSTTSAPPTTLVTSTTSAPSTTSATFTNSAPTISATSTTSATSKIYATSDISTSAAISTTSDTSTSSAISTISGSSTKSLAFSTGTILNQNSTQTPAVTTTDATTAITTDSVTTTFSASTLTSMVTPIVNTIDTLVASEIIVTPESIRSMLLLNSSTDSSSSTLASFQTMTPTSLAQTDFTSLTEQGKTKDLPIFTNSLETTTSSYIVRNESELKNATNGMTDPSGIRLELNDQFSTGSPFHSGEINSTGETTIAVPSNPVQERDFPLDKTEDVFPPHEKKEDSRGDIPDMTS